MAFGRLVVIITACLWTVEIEPAFAGQPCAAEIVLDQPQGALAADRQVAFSITVKNPGKRPLLCTLPTAQVYDVLVLKEGREIWRWSRGIRFATVLTPFSLPAGGVRTYSASWEPVEGFLHNTTGNPVAAGDYEAVAVFKSRPEIRSRPLVFPILPP